jgi:hypothetical protein
MLNIQYYIHYQAGIILPLPTDKIRESKKRETNNVVEEISVPDILNKQDEPKTKNSKKICTIGK